MSTTKKFVANNFSVDVSGLHAENSKRFVNSAKPQATSDKRQATSDKRQASKGTSSNKRWTCSQLLFVREGVSLWSINRPWIDSLP